MSNTPIGAEKMCFMGEFYHSIIEGCNPAILILAETSAPRAFSALSWARNSAGATPRRTCAWLAAGSAGRRACTSPAVCASATAGDCGGFVSPGFQEKRRVRPPRPSTSRPGRKTPNQFTRPARERSERRGPEGMSGPAPGRAFFAHAPVHPPERPSGLRRPPRPSPRRPPPSPQPPPLGAPRSASQRGGITFSTVFHIFM